MGQKVNPNALRLGILHTWNSRWFSERKSYYRKLLYQDIQLRKLLMRRLKGASISEVGIERSIHQVTVVLYVARPGMVIGRGGEELTATKKIIETFFTDQGEKTKIEIRVEGIKKPDLEPYLVASNIADQLVKRIPYKRAVSQAQNRVMGAGAKGIRVMLSGRINGAEISRREKFTQGTVPLTTIRENVRFAHVPALTKSGYIGVKVWICLPE
jgi:small subunit ribosomal protein S3